MSKANFASILRETWALIVNFFKPFGLKDSALTMPSPLYKMGLKLGLVNYLGTLIALVFSFMLKMATTAIEAKLILLGIILFIIYKGQDIIKESLDVICSSEQQKYDNIFQNEIVLRGAQIIGKTNQKVYKQDKKVYRLIKNEEIINVVNNYISNFWDLKTRHLFNVIELLSVILMLAFAIITNTSISQKIFIPMVVIFSLLSFFTSAYISTKRKDYYGKRREYFNKKDIIKNDLLRVPAIIPEDMDMRIETFRELATKDRSNELSFYMKIRKTDLFLTIIECFAQYGIIIASLCAMDFATISLATITEITATLVILETALRYVSRMARTMSSFNERITILNKEEGDMANILDVYNYEINAKEGPEISSLQIDPFHIQYVETSENDKPFSLISESTININKGEIVILSGVSGSGKSTFMKMLTDRIRLHKSTKIPSTRRFLFYDETLTFGSLSIFEELFCLDKNPHLVEMEFILKQLHLWQELNTQCHDIWQWMKEKQFSSLSNGQKQRLVLAKMLYHLNSSIDVVVLDECTSGLDEVAKEGADVEKILTFICNYCNKDKERIIIISTHQNLDGFKKQMSNHQFKNLIFEKNGDTNTVKEM